jgi:hypothetical protein
MERVLVVGFTVGLLLVCLFWAYGYFRRRTKRPTGATSPRVKRTPD